VALVDPDHPHALSTRWVLMAKHFSRAYARCPARLYIVIVARAPCPLKMIAPAGDLDTVIAQRIWLWPQKESNVKRAPLTTEESTVVSHVIRSLSEFGFDFTLRPTTSNTHSFASRHRHRPLRVWVIAVIARGDTSALYTPLMSTTPVPAECPTCPRRTSCPDWLPCPLASLSSVPCSILLPRRFTISTGSVAAQPRIARIHVHAQRRELHRSRIFSM